MPGDVTMAIFGLIVGWALGVATAILWPRGKALPPLGGPPKTGGYQPPEGHRQPTNPPQGTGAIAGGSRVIFHFHGQTPDDVEHFRKHMEKWLDQQEERPDQCPVT